MPQHAKRIKIRRKALRQPDEFETLTMRAVAWAEENRPIVIGVVTTVVVVALLGIVVSRWRAGREERAGLAFQAARQAFDAGNKFAEAADAFAATARDYPSTTYGRLANLYRGYALSRQGDAAGAATAYGEFLATAPEPDYIRQQALAGLGHAREKTGDTAGALEAYTQAGALEGAYQTDALLGAARLQELTGHADAARDIYSRLLEGSPEADLRAFLESKLPPGSSGSRGTGGETAEATAGP